MEGCTNHGVKRVLTKVQACVNSGNYYEAHQMYRTLYFRYLGQRKYAEVIQLLYDGSILFLQKKQYTSGADLGLLLIDVLKKSEVKSVTKYFDKLIDIFALMNPTSPERETFVQSALRWSIIGTTYKTGHPDLHEKLAHIYWREKNYTAARQHFLYTRNGSECGEMLVELHRQYGYADEMDLFITQIILQYLCLRNMNAANKVFKTYVKEHPRIKVGPPFNVPLLNFLCLLLRSIEKKEFPMFTVLCEQYYTSLNKDPCFLQYLDKIGQLFFNVQPPPSYSRGLFSSVLQSLFNDLDEDDSNQDQRTTSSTHVVSELD